ncbi:hypothetical protein SDC9_106617 [bioreactor metagenome]|uniref:Uncharacterized protein n=1 Tax=bioreactor metagenome TaxID=1076179 RepID=A0A645B588_9ZZZZ
MHDPLFGHGICRHTAKRDGKCIEIHWGRMLGKKIAQQLQDALITNECGGAADPRFPESKGEGLVVRVGKDIILLAIGVEHRFCKEPNQIRLFKQGPYLFWRVPGTVKPTNQTAHAGSKHKVDGNSLLFKSLQYRDVGNTPGPSTGENQGNLGRGPQGTETQQNQQHSKEAPHTVSPTDQRGNPGCH